MNKGCWFVVGFTVFMVSGFLGYTFMLCGFQLDLRPTDFLMFVYTPLAFILISLGVGGLFLVYQSRQFNGRMAWLKLGVGGGLLVLAFVWLEILLNQCY